ncbi:MAG: chromosomal replication initiator protein DnaA [Clostridia bacterium]|nr:chromosomal replication initiator protein DnaA [Clostridia bacterium]
MAYLDGLNAVWQDVKKSFLDDMESSAVELWFGNMNLISFKEDVMTFSVDSAFKYDLIKQKFLTKIEDKFESRLGFRIKVEITCTEAAPKNDGIDYSEGGTGFHYDDEDEPEEIIMPDPILPSGDGYEAELFRSKTEEFAHETPEEREERIKDEKHRAMIERFRREADAERKYEDEGKKLPVGSIGSTLPPYNFEYTFDNFIVGGSNKFAHAACTAVAANPAMNYNPLFIYGPSGLGKTHLLYAITNEIKKKKPNVKIIYIKGEDFTTQFIEALAAQMTNEFRNKYRCCDVLLIDDIQFIAGKTSTQEEFFHTFNALYEEHKQIILTSDRPPRDMKTLEDRLKTRFEWGLLADIQPPDFELRTAIIKKKAEQVGIIIPEDVLTYLAENLRSNIRQIEGAMKKLGALAFLSGQEITMEVARGCIADLLGGEEPVSVTVDKIFSAVYKKYGITKEDLIGKNRSREIAQARHVAIYLIRKITEMSLPNIGKIFNRDHTTALASFETIEKRVKTDAILTLDIGEMTKEVTGEAE